MYGKWHFKTQHEAAIAAVDMVHRRYVPWYVNAQLDVIKRMNDSSSKVANGYAYTRTYVRAYTTVVLENQFIHMCT